MEIAMKQLYSGGDILTMGSGLYAQAVLVENGRVAAVGERDELAALAPDAAPVSLEGRTMLPGFIDTHSHFSQVAAQLLRARGIDPATAAPAELAQACRRTQRYYASYGITTMQDGAVTEQTLPIYRLLAQKRLLSLELVACPDRGTFCALSQLFPECRRSYSRNLRIGGIKIYLDGSPLGGTAWLREPYMDAHCCGEPVMRDDAVFDCLCRGEREGVPVLAHCSGDAACAQFLRCAERCARQHPASARLRNVILQAQLLGRDQMEQARELGMTASFFTPAPEPAEEAQWRSLGGKRASRVNAAASALACGLPFSLHQDAPLHPPDVMKSIQRAVCRQDCAGQPVGQAEEISVLAALRAVTVNAAWQYGEEREKGAITPGRQADFVLLERNPLLVPPEQLGTIRVCETVKRGIVRYRRA